MSNANQAFLVELADVLARGDVHGALRALNERTPFRHTGVYRFDQSMLHNVALYDRWQADAPDGEDAPKRLTFCGIVGNRDEPLQVKDGRTDTRFPWMQSNAVVSYCGVPVHRADGTIQGTLCHFDLQPCQAPTGEVELLEAAAPLFADFLAGSVARDSAGA